LRAPLIVAEPGPFKSKVAALLGRGRSLLVAVRTAKRLDYFAHLETGTNLVKYGRSLR
jgi:hypothetical protein